MRIIHLHSTVQALFGKLDDEGNVTDKIPISVELSQLNEEVFKKVAEQLARVWVKLQEDQCPTPSE